MKKSVRRLTLSRETLLRLDETTLRQLDGGAAGAVITPETKQPACYSPLCVPTYWQTCETGVTPLTA
jgi:hypothetical protein